MTTDEFFTKEEKKQLFALYRKLLQLSGDTLQKEDCRNLKQHLIRSMQTRPAPRDVFGLNPIVKDMQTAVIVAEEIGMRRASILGIMLHDPVRCGACTAEDVGREFVCRRHARHTHHDCRPCQHHAPNKGRSRRRGTAPRG